jgi:biopolymer transport protein ExbB/TolQ
MNKLWSQPDRLLVMVVSLILGGLFIALLTALLHGETAVIVLDHHAEPPKDYPFQYPWTIQNLMHLFFFMGLGELYCRWRNAVRENAFIDEKLLPEDYETVLQAHDLPAIHRQVMGRYDQENGFLPNLIDLCILQFQASRSVDQVVGVLNSSLELIQHKVDLRYSILRYIVWVIPTIGFIGTVVGIAISLKMAGVEDPPLAEIAKSLGVSFYTTLVALVLSAILVLLLHLVQSREERAVGNAGHYTLANLVNRLYVGAG